MFTAETVIFVAVTYVLMIVAFFLSRYRTFHITLMSSLVVVDFLFPIYLYLNKDWWRRLVEQGELLSFMVWMHLLLVITLYVLYVVQISAARGILSDRDGARDEHKTQAKGILIIKGLVLLSGAFLVETDSSE